MTVETQGVKGWKVSGAEADVAGSPGSLAVRALRHTRLQVLNYRGLRFEGGGSDFFSRSGVSCSGLLMLDVSFSAGMHNSAVFHAETESMNGISASRDVSAKHLCLKDAQLKLATMKPLKP